MGCDIHFVIERKEGDHWIGCFSDDTFHERWYEAFSRLAGVRGEGPSPNGLPNDISELAKLEVADWVGDGHSHSHLSLKEFIERWYDKKLGRSELDAYCRMLFEFYPKDELSLESEYRVIFFFDN